ncbi:MAG TPA: radical SAM/SPASM domain-containing protein [Steroidobacteraceae bacterium]
MDSPVRELPLVTLHLTDRCNSRCVACDYWRNGERDVSTESVARLLPDLDRLGTGTVMISGGEPLLHRQWAEIATLLRQGGLRLWLVTSGLSLRKHAGRVARLFESVTVSLDGTDPTMYAAIRGVDAFDVVCDGIRAVASAGVAPGVRVTVQRANFAALPEFVVLARTLGARQVSFLAADLGNPHAFGRRAGFQADVGLRPDDLPAFAATLDVLERDHAADFESGFIEESPRKLRRLLAYYTAACGLGDYPSVRCNAPEFSAVVGADGRVSPCFFIAGPEPLATAHTSLPAALDGAAMVELRRDIRAGRRPECRTCVCSLWRDADERRHLAARSPPSAAKWGVA